MEIQWLGHSSMRIRSGGITLITDPYASSLGLTIANQQADVVTVSNSHPHHSHLEAIQGKPRVLKGPGEYEIGSLYISGLGAPLGDPEIQRQINTIFTIRAEGLMLCHLGDISRPLTSRQAEALRHVEVLMAPVGGNCTLEISKVAELVNLIAPRILIPLHYKTEGVQVELEPMDNIQQELGITEENFASQNRLNVTATNLPRELRLVALQRAS